MIVVADAGPLRYLVLIDEQALLPLLYGSILIPAVVADELTREATPAKVRAWMSTPPRWLELRNPRQPWHELPSSLGRGETEAIALAREIHADALLVDDGAARREASRLGIPLQGTLGVLDLAASKGLVDFQEALGKLLATNFRVSPAVIRFFLDRDLDRRAR